MTTSAGAPALAPGVGAAASESTALYGSGGMGAKVGHGGALLRPPMTAAAAEWPRLGSGTGDAAALEPVSPSGASAPGTATSHCTVSAATAEPT